MKNEELLVQTIANLEQISQVAQKQLGENREWQWHCIAVSAMNAFIARGGVSWTYKELSEEAYNIADCMMAEREKRKF